MGGTVSNSIGNRYGKKIWVKYDVEKKYVQMEDYTVEGQVGFSEISAGVGVSVSRKYDWNKIQMDFTPIKSGDFKELTIDCKDSKVVYITIVAEDGEIICKTWPMNVANSIVITEEGGLRMAEESNPLKAHRKYDKLGTGTSVVSNSATRSKQTSEENTSYSARKAKREPTPERATRTVSSPAKPATKSSDTAVTTKKTTTPMTSGGDKQAYAKAEVRHTIALKRYAMRKENTLNTKAFVFFFIQRNYFMSLLTRFYFVYKWKKS